MAYRWAIKTENAPPAIGPYSQGVLYFNGLLYLLETSGQIGIDPLTRQLAEGTEAQTDRALDNIAAILGDVGWDFGNVIKSRVFLANMDDFELVNELYRKKFYQSDLLPARVLVQPARLPLNALFEIECTAIGDEVSREAIEKYGIKNPLGETAVIPP
jgi:reactive intermediate/imine deaminase